MSDRHKELLGALGRVVLGAVLVYAGATKAAGPSEEFAMVIANYRLLPPDMVLTVASFMPWAEVFLGWALVLGVFVPHAAAAAGGLFSVFLFALLSVLARGIQLPNCGCFGGDWHFTVPQTLLLDSCLLALCWAAFRHGRSLSLDKWAERGYTPRR